MDSEKKKQNITKKKIINSAITLFANKDFSSTSTREICKLAGVNLSLLSYYFGTKDGLYTSIIESIINYGLDYLRADIEKTNELSKMDYNQRVELYCSLLEKYIDFLYSENVPRSFVILMLKEQTGTSSKYSEMYTKKIDVLYTALRKILASILEKKENDKNVIFEVYSIIGQILSFKLMDSATLSALKQDGYTATDNKKIHTIVKSYVNQNLINLGVKIGAKV